jgi:NAD(P)-dependent dehydrogenase (short-subunit alcohol dehydrogenase family)
MEIAGSTVMVTGASGGLGAALCEQFLSRGAASVYAAARDVTRVRVRGAVPVTVDITDPRSVGELAARCDDVGVLVNNTGTAHTDRPVLAPSALGCPSWLSAHCIRFRPGLRVP